MGRVKEYSILLNDRERVYNTLTSSFTEKQFELLKELISIEIEIEKLKR